MRIDLKREPVFIWSFVSILISSVLLNWDAFAAWLSGNGFPGWLVVVVFQVLSAIIQRSKVTPTADPKLTQ